MSIKALEEKRTDLQTQMNDMLEAAKAEQRAMSAEEIAKFDEYEEEIRNIDKTIEREERNNMSEVKEVKNEMTIEERDIHSFAEYIRCTALNMEYRTDPTNMTKGDNGAVIPKTIINKIVEKVSDISPIYRLATHYNAKGTVAIPKEDTSTDEITVAYGTEFSDLVSRSNKFGATELTGYLYGALTKISKSLLNNSDINLTEWVVNKMAKKIAKFIEGECLNGTTNKVSGVVGTYDSTNMKVTLAANNKVTMDELIDLMDKVPDAYQTDAIFVMKRSTRNAIRKLKDGEGRYLLNYDPSAKFGYTIFGHDVYCSDNVDALGSASKNVIFYGDFSGLAIKESEQAEIQILREVYAAQHAIGVVAWGELDAKLEDVQKVAVAVTPA